LTVPRHERGGATFSPNSPRRALRRAALALFKRLHQADRYEGNGVGLALCKVIVERYGGRIWGEPQLGSGSAFLFTLAKIQEPNAIAGLSVATELVRPKYSKHLKQQGLIA